jgi:hypothetical protein
MPATGNPHFRGCRTENSVLQRRVAPPEAPFPTHRQRVTHTAIRQLKIVERVSADFRNGLEFVGDDDSSRMQWLRGQHRTLNDSCLLEFLFPQLLDGYAFVDGRSGAHWQFREG